VTLFDTVSEHRAGGVVIYEPDLATLDIAALGITALSAIAIFRFKTPTLRVVGAAAVAGIAHQALIA
jgi:hypothetical protein